MVNIKYGNILDATENMICHQCNTEGVFGGGLAYQIGKKWPECAAGARSFAKLFGEEGVLGMVYYFTSSDPKRVIANCFSQNPNFTTNYEMLEKAFDEILGVCSYIGYSVAVPFKYGCGIASGDWNKVLDIFTRLSAKWNVNISIYYLKGSVE